ncbi:MAG: chemotaxis protein CheW [Spirochaetales bacterium]|nr:chemotaxis protein CheW [Spirochaetales bacterium]
METENSTILELEEHSEALQTAKQVDFKMVTFSLAGKEYGIDIMKVKEISKAERFTYVPNTAPYVRGVHNLRGDIISIIDLRIMFHLPAVKKKEGDLEDMIILRLDNYFIGVIVDSIDKVVGISSKSIQPPHPLFGDINIKFIRGIVENDSKLYIILDVEKILGAHTQEEAQAEKQTVEQSSEKVHKEIEHDVDLGFIVDTLKTFKKFRVTDLNLSWVKQRFNVWKKEKGSDAESLQLKDVADADQYLQSFYSPSSGRMWDDDYMAAVTKALPESSNGPFTVWNPGCGKGYETYSLTIALKKKLPDAALKVWANDNDLLSISTAPNLFFREEEIPGHIAPYFVESKNGFQIVPEIRDVILFEYHDILNPNPFPEVDLIVARDLLSFMEINDQQKLLKEFWEKLKPNGVLLLGANEKAPDMDWTAREYGAVIAYTKKNV